MRGNNVYSNITGTCILHSRATLDDLMFSSDHPVPLKTSGFSYVCSKLFLTGAFHAGNGGMIHFIIINHDINHN